MAVTRADVAARAGVSTAVVSYVLNNGPRPVSTSARERVLAAIEELGYQRDAVARYLRTGKTQSLGLVLPDLGLPYYTEVTRALSSGSTARGYQLLISNSEWDAGLERRELASLAERRVDGVILMSVDPEQDFTPLSALGIPLAVIDRPEFARRATAAATEHLIGHGHTAIGLIGWGTHLVANRRRHDSWESTLRAAGLTVRPEYAATAPVSRSGGYAAAQELLGLPSPPTAVYVESDAQAAGVLRACKDLGVDVPGDLAVVSSEGTELARYTVPSLTSTEQPTATIAAEALDAVLSAGPGEVVWLRNPEYTLVTRESCGCGPD
jgi:LacI family transcriptional regulator